MAAQTDSLDQLKAWIRIGVLPFGAHVLRIDGRWETPLSSWNRIQALRRRAFFLVPASSGLTRAALSVCRAPWLAWLAAAASIPWRLGFSTHGQDDSAHRSIAPSPGPLAAASTDRCRSRAPVRLAATLSRPAGVAGHPTWACGPTDRRHAGQECRRAAILCTNDSRSGD